MKKKRCSICNKKKFLAEFGISVGRTTPTGHKAACNFCRNSRQSELRRIRVKSGLCMQCPNKRDTGVLCQTCKDKQKKWRADFKREVFEAYGGAVCVCCKEDKLEFLSLDHINGDGAAHRRSLSTTSVYGSKIYHWAKKNGYPKIFRVLCMNCNFAYGKFGYCPHETGSNY